MARVFGIETIRMADADVLPYNYEEYGREVAGSGVIPRRKADAVFGSQSPSFAEAAHAAHQFEQAGAKMLRKQQNPGND